MSPNMWRPDWCLGASDSSRQARTRFGYYHDLIGSLFQLGLRLSMPKFVKLLLACLLCLGVIAGLVLLVQRLF